MGYCSNELGQTIQYGRHFVYIFIYIYVVSFQPLLEKAFRYSFKQCVYSTTYSQQFFAKKAL